MIFPRPLHHAVTTPSDWLWLENFTNLVCSLTLIFQRLKHPHARLLCKVTIYLHPPHASGGDPVRRLVPGLADIQTASPPLTRYPAPRNATFRVGLAYPNIFAAPIFISGPMDRGSGSH